MPQPPTGPLKAALAPHAASAAAAWLPLPPAKAVPATGNQRQPQNVWPAESERKRERGEGGGELPREFAALPASGSNICKFNIFIKKVFLDRTKKQHKADDDAALQTCVCGEVMWRCPKRGIERERSERGTSGLLGAPSVCVSLCFDREAN